MGKNKPGAARRPSRGGKVGSSKVAKAYYEADLGRLEVELVKQQEWIRANGLRVVVLFEGRDAAGKGGAIQRITESVNPRHTRVVTSPGCPEPARRRRHRHPRRPLPSVSRPAELTAALGPALTPTGQR